MQFQFQQYLLLLLLHLVLLLLQPSPADSLRFRLAVPISLSLSLSLAVTPSLSPSASASSSSSVSASSSTSLCSRASLLTIRGGTSSPSLSHSHSKSMTLSALSSSKTEAKRDAQSVCRALAVGVEGEIERDRAREGEGDKEERQDAEGLERKISISTPHPLVAAPSTSTSSLAAEMPTPAVATAGGRRSLSIAQRLRDLLPSLHHFGSLTGSTSSSSGGRHDDTTRLRCFLALSMLFMFLGKWSSLRVPFILQRAVDRLSTDFISASATPSSSLLQPPWQTVVQTLIFYGLAKGFAVVCAELKTCLFTNVSQRILRDFSHSIFAHLHTLDASFYLSHPAGVLSVAYVRAVRGFQQLLFQLVFSVAPIALELGMVAFILFRSFGGVFSFITLTTFILYLSYTIGITRLRTRLRQQLVKIDNQRNGYFIDSLLNHEIVKLFTNEDRAINQYLGKYLAPIEQLNIQNTYSIGFLNVGQAFMFAIGLTCMLLVALTKIKKGEMTVGDLVAVNTMLLQLEVPMDYVGWTYQEITQALVDMSYIRHILAGKEPKVKDSPTAASLDLLSPRKGPSTLEFRNVTFSYDTAEPTSNANGSQSIAAQPEVLNGVSFSINAGQNIAIVGPSGSGKSTTLKLITRMLDPTSGEIIIDGVRAKDATLKSLRQRIAVVPQDTSLFDETIDFNIRYGHEDATDEDILWAVRKSNLDDTIAKLPLGLNTKVGERGTRLSGGERQKISIARAILRKPSLILCDEVTSSVDAFAERDIVETLRNAMEHRTTITVAHRLSSIVHCDQILVLNKGQIVEAGTHQELLQCNGIYRKMWDCQHNIADPSGEDYAVCLNK